MHLVFDTAWAGAAADSVTGKNNKVGATRWNWYKGPNGGKDGFELGENVSFSIFRFAFVSSSFFCGSLLLTRAVYSVERV